MRRKIPEGVKTVKDPHHRGFSEWCYYDKDFYIRTEVQSKWTKVKKIHPTPARVRALASLVEVN